MKKRKIKLFASLTSLVMVVAVMAVGIWAATSASFALTSTVAFSASGFTGTFDASISGMKDVEPEYGDPVVITAGDAQVIRSWDEITLNFADNGNTPIVYTFTMSGIYASVENKGVQATITLGDNMTGFVADEETADVYINTTANLKLTVVDGQKTVATPEDKTLTTTVNVQIINAGVSVTATNINLNLAYTLETV